MVWGKVIGAMVGLGFGHGFLGMVAGVIVGHWVDTRLGRRPPAVNASQRQQVFTAAVTALAAKLAKADGVVSRQEVDAFKAQFSIPASLAASVGALYDDAKRDAAGYEVPARNLATTFAKEPFLLVEVLAALYRIALVDGPMHPAEQAFLDRVAVIFGLSPRPFAETAVVPANDPYVVLGVGRATPMADIKAAWRRLTREHHPDTLTAKGLPSEYVEMATRKMATINAAYDSIRAERGEQ